MTSDAADVGLRPDPQWLPADGLGPVLDGKASKASFVLKQCAIIAMGGSSYGFALGLWRAPEQGVYGAIKLPLLLLSLWAICSGVTILSASLLRSRMAPIESLLVVLTAISSAALVLWALTPISLFFVWNTPPPVTEDRDLASLFNAHALLLWHLTAIGTACILGVQQLTRVLQRHASSASTRKLRLLWITTLAGVGSQLSWLLRPWVGKAHLPPQLFRPDATDGSFFGECQDIFGSIFGPAGAAMMVVLGLLSAAVLFWSMVRHEYHDVLPTFLDTGIALTLTSGRSGTVTATWDSLYDLRFHEDTVYLKVRSVEEMADDGFAIRCDGVLAAHAVYRRILVNVQENKGPYRDATPS